MVLQEGISSLSRVQLARTHVAPASKLPPLCGVRTLLLTTTTPLVQLARG